MSHPSMPLNARQDLCLPSPLHQDPDQKSQEEYRMVSEGASVDGRKPRAQDRQMGTDLASQCGS